MKNVLIDASSAILLFKAGLFNDLLATYAIRITESVYDELTGNVHTGAQEFRVYTEKGKMTVRPGLDGELLDCVPLSGLAHLDKGERDTIHQFYAGLEDFIIIDDGNGAKYCRDHHIPYINALLFPKILLFSGAISKLDCDSRIERIIRIGRYAQDIIKYAVNCSIKDVEFFLPKN